MTDFVDVHYARAMIREMASGTGSDHEETVDGRYIRRRQRSRLVFEFVDDADNVLGTMQRTSVFALNGTITTADGRYQSKGTGFDYRVENLATGQRVLGRPVGFVLPDGTPLHGFDSGGRMARRCFVLVDPTGQDAVTFRWLPPVHAWRGLFPLGEAFLRPGLEPTVDLVPLVAYAFQLFQDSCHPKGGG